MIRGMFILLHLVLTGGFVAAQEIQFIYPAQGQSGAQQEADMRSCNGWATDQTGLDPYTAELELLRNQQARQAQLDASTSTASSQPDGSVLRGAARGAAAGAIIGEVADNDPGTGAAVGATVGALRGARQRRQAAQATSQQQQSQADAMAQQNSLELQQFQNGQQDFNRAFRTCMEGRGYTIS